ncbi:MAG: DUF2459 domain-containing protein [Gammaproteobacteria bacterium]|nr:DUF2459 domain-containing protein [Gammaproteobacteria bacterium]MDH5801276.1 DUF2459 domain-containing protein [Gammaproteobacteria bacterium]
MASILVRNVVAWLVLALGACASGPKVITALEVERQVSQQPQLAALIGTKPRKHKIYLTGVGWHTGLVLDLADMDLLAHMPVFQQVPSRFPGAQYLEFGWGDKRFYQNPGQSLRLTANALLVPSHSTMHVVAMRASPQRHLGGAGEVIELCLDDKQFLALGLYLDRSFKTGPSGVVATLPGPGTSWFFDAEGDYHLLNTCNTWTAKALAGVGMPLQPGLYWSATSILDYVKQELKSLDAFGAPYPGRKSIYSCH